MKEHSHLAHGIAESLAISGNEDPISVKPMFVRHLKIPNVGIVPITDEGATWDLFVAWQRRKTAGPAGALIDALGRKSRATC
jgi:hypothetical protein